MHKSYRTLFIGIFLSILIMSSGMVLIHYDIQSYTLVRLQQQHTINQFYINEFKNKQVQIISNLATNKDVEHYLSNRNLDAEHLLHNFLLSDSQIMKMRFIDIRGDEVIRFDRTRDGEVKQITKEKLQNKSERPFFKEFISLPKGSSCFSEFDLNMEHGKINIPFNPTLRVGMGVYNKGQLQGVIVINYYMDKWISNLQQSNSADFYLIDDEGYFLMHPSPEYSWSRYRTPSANAPKYFKSTTSELYPSKGEEYRWVDSNTAAFRLDFFGHTLFALYQPKLSTDQLLLRRLFEFGFIIFLSLMLIIVPLVNIIRLNQKHIKEEKLKNEILVIHQSKLDSMGDMLGSLAHQWRQPLNSIGLIMQDIASAYHHNELTKEYLNSSKKGIMHQLHFMSQTIDTFRNFFTNAHKEAGCDLSQIIEEIHHLYRTQLDAHGIKMEIYYENHQQYHDVENDESPFYLISYPAEIKQILLNLLSNAKDALIHTTHEPKIITFKVIAREETLSVEITDHGGGIDAEITDRIFEPYFTTKDIGTGLGLYIAKTLAELHLKGSLTFESDGGWSTFKITIPRLHPSSS